jgi:hypothetical protein
LPGTLEAPVGVQDHRRFLTDNHVPIRDEPDDLRHGALLTRRPWTDRDCGVLVNLVGKRHARWHEMESKDSHLFDIPRNQQAYRDKARLLKVEYLLTDVALPPGFDQVHLARKDIDRVQAQGKNPHRRVSDVSGDRAINTNL